MSIGVSETVSKDEERYVRFTNLEAVLAVLATPAYVIYSVYNGNYLLSVLQGAISVCMLFVFLLNHKQFHKTARMVFLFSLNSVILVNACFIGNKSGVHEFYYISYTIPFLLFNVRDYKYIISGVLLAVIGFNLYQNIHHYFTAYNLDEATQLNIFQINSWVIFVLFGSAVYMLAWFNFKTETELGDANKKLEESNKKLEESNQKLIAQAMELKRSNEDLEQFGYIISHDLKAPVRNISSFMNILGKQIGETCPKASKELIDMSKDSAIRLTRQIDDMLSYCRVDRNLPPVAPVDLNQMLSTIQMELKEKIREKNAVIVIEQQLPVLDDLHSTMLHHVFQNLIANGIKFNTQERPEVRVNFTQKGKEFTFSVADNGIGIDNKYSSKLFQMFKRLHSVDQFEGTGIGLAVCKKIINFYNGEIWFEGQPDKGTTFYFTLKKPVGKVTPSIQQQLSAVLKAA